ncbi:hypothetical protein EYR40_008530 [Pleurotus pulmonarius]|nr:hypothetical protein EYR36_009347 [Pleurotus pulmonarius]KAF4592844.1 hypothetical protein EYR38_008548 [Pleurotus pulmonarius]KAF4593738.1 hypothetical protein EYR40_008530 [Pleurotus pulmonarius]
MSLPPDSEQKNLGVFNQHAIWTFADPSVMPVAERPEAWEQIQSHQNVLDNVEMESERFARGGSAAIYKGILKTDDNRNVPVIVKCYAAIHEPGKSRADAYEKTAQLIAKEVKVWRNLNHPNVVRFYGLMMGNTFPWNTFFVPVEPQYPAVVCAFCDGGKVMDYLQKNPEARRLPLVLDAAQGYVYLHKYNIAHGDVKPENILIKTTADGVRAVISDFGSSRMIDEADFPGTLSYTWPYIAPEIKKSPYLYTKATDVFCFALTALVIISGVEIFAEEEDRYMARHRLELGERPNRDDHKSSEMSDEVWKLLEESWVQEADGRKSMGDIASALSRLSSDGN